MNLEQVTAELRPRPPWEAADFGARMIRRDAGAIYRVWFSVTLPLLALALLGVLYSPFPSLALFAYWWLEPVVDAPVLLVISRRLFGERVSVRAALRATPRLAWQNRAFLLTPLRLHFARSTAMPLTQLERLTGAARRKRAALLNRRTLRYGMGVTAVYQHLWIAVWLGLALIGFTLIPMQYQETLVYDVIFTLAQSGNRSQVAFYLLSSYAAQSVLEPWFVGAGFGLYVNCRTQLEAWDVEVAFRRMVQRRARGAAAAMTVLAVLALPVMITAPFPALAQHSAEPAEDPGFAGYWSDEEIAPAMEAVMDREELDRTRIVEEWRRIEHDEDESAPAIELPEKLAVFLRQVGLFLARILESAVWLGLAVLILTLFLTRARWLPYLNAAPASRPLPRRVVLASGEILADTLPTDIPAEVGRLWRDGQKRRALSLLYRASVFAAVQSHGVRIPVSATEGACVAAVDEQADAAHAAFFRRVVNAWTWLAYGAHEPADDTVASLCADWAAHYGEPV